MLTSDWKLHALEEICRRHKLSEHSILEEEIFRHEKNAFV